MPSCKLILYAATRVFTARGPLAPVWSLAQELLQRTSLEAAQPDQRLLIHYLADGADTRGPLAFAMGQCVDSGAEGR